MLEWRVEETTPPLACLLCSLGEAVRVRVNLKGGLPACFRAVSMGLLQIHVGSLVERIVLLQPLRPTPCQGYYYGGASERCDRGECR